MRGGKLSAKPSPRLKRPPRLTKAARDVLEALCNGGFVHAYRTFPHPHLYRVHRSEEPCDVTEEEVQLLLAHRCILATPKDHPVCDEIDYHVTEAGRQVHALKGKMPKPEPGQLDLLAGI